MKRIWKKLWLACEIMLLSTSCHFLTWCHTKINLLYGSWAIISARCQPTSGSCKVHDVIQILFGVGETSSDQSVAGQVGTQHLRHVPLHLKIYKYIQYHTKYIYKFSDQTWFEITAQLLNSAFCNWTETDRTINRLILENLTNLKFTKAFRK